MQSQEVCSGCAHHQKCKHIMCIYISVCWALVPKLSGRGILWQALKVGNLGKDLQPSPTGSLFAHWRQGSSLPMPRSKCMQMCTPPEGRWGVPCFITAAHCEMKQPQLQPKVHTYKSH